MSMCKVNNENDECQECIVCVRRIKPYGTAQVFEFPVSLPYGYEFVMLVKEINGKRNQIKPVKKDDEFYIKAQDYSSDASYFMHYKCPKGIEVYKRTEEFYVS